MKVSNFHYRIMYYNLEYTIKSTKQGLEQGLALKDTRLPRLRLRTSNCSVLLIYLPRKDERLSHAAWLDDV